MEKYAILLGYFDKQQLLIQRLATELLRLELSSWERGYVFALKAQHLFTAVEDLLKQVAKAFENHIEDLGRSHQELLLRLHTPVPQIRPALLSEEAFLVLDKLRTFRHFVRHGYGCELDRAELLLLQQRLAAHFPQVEADLMAFRSYLLELLSS